LQEGIFVLKLQGKLIEENTLLKRNILLRGENCDVEIFRVSSYILKFCYHALTMSGRNSLEQHSHDSTQANDNGYDAAHAQ
jgi:hypothetical protein